MKAIEWINRDGEEKVSFVFDDSAEAIQAMVDADATSEVGKAIAHAMAVAVTNRDDVAFDIATQASEEMAVKMGHSEEQAKSATAMLKDKYFATS